MHKVTMSVHPHPLLTISEEQRQPIVISTDRQQALPLRQRTISEERLQLTKTDTEILSAHQPVQPTISETLQRPIVTDMETRQEQTSRARITLVILTLVIQTHTDVPQALLPPQRIILATQQPLIVTRMVRLKVHPLPPQIILGLATPNNEATTPTPPFGLGENIPH